MGSWWAWLALGVVGVLGVEQLGVDPDPPSPASQPSSSAPGGPTGMERIVSPTLGPFIPSPEIKFPEPLAPPVYGEAKIPGAASVFSTADTGLSDVLTPPDYPYAAGHGAWPPPFGSDSPRGHHRLPPLIFGGAAKDEDLYVAYDVPEGEYFHPPPVDARPRPTAPPPSGGDPPSKAGKTTAWKTLVAALTTLVPIGLFLAALPPNYVTITNSTSSRVGKSEGDGEWGAAEGARRLTEGEEYPVLGLMGRFGVAALVDPECESRIFCEMSRLGRGADANVVQRVFWRVVNDAPDVLTEMVGLRKLFKAARTDSCLTFQCKDTRSGD